MQRLAEPDRAHQRGAQAGQRVARRAAAGGWGGGQVRQMAGQQLLQRQVALALINEGLCCTAKHFTYQPHDMCVHLLKGRALKNKKR